MALFLINNQYGQLLTRDLNWVDPRDAHALFYSPHKDNALNQLVELNSKDASLRGKVIECAADDLGRPLLNQLTETASTT